MEAFPSVYALGLMLMMVSQYQSKTILLDSWSAGERLIHAPSYELYAPRFHPSFSPTFLQQKRPTLMKIQVNTGHNIDGDAAFVAHVETTVAKTLSHFSEHITRVEVHVTDENAGKHGHDDKKCIMEARLEGRQPIAVTCEAATSGQAVAGAADKLKSVLESTMGRLREQRAMHGDKQH